MLGPVPTRSLGIWIFEAKDTRCYNKFNANNINDKTQYINSKLKFTLRIHQSSDNTAGRPHQLKQTVSSPQVCVLTTQLLEWAQQWRTNQEHIQLSTQMKGSGPWQLW